MDGAEVADLLAIVDVPLVLVNERGSILAANSAASELGVYASNVGGCFRAIAASALGAEAADWLVRTLAPAEPTSRELLWNGRRYYLNIRPIVRSGHGPCAMLAFRQSSLEFIQSPAATVDLSGVILAANVAWREFAVNHSLGQALAVGQNYLSFVEQRLNSNPDTVRAVSHALADVVSGRCATFAFDLPLGSDGSAAVHRSVFAPSTRLGRSQALVLVVEAGQSQSLEQMRRQAAALKSSITAVFITDAEGRIDWVNEAFERLSGFPAHELIGQTPALFDRTGSSVSFASTLRRVRETGSAWSGEVVQRSQSGDLHTVLQTITPITGRLGQIDHFAVTHEDVSRHKQAQERMLYMAEHDELTGLWNRKTFFERLIDSIERHERLGGKLAVLFLDLDRFKDTNDTLGHLIGDQILVEIGRRLKHNVRESDVLARFGGDEFVIFLEETGDRESISFIVEKILNGFNRPVEVGGRSMFISASAGITVFPEDGRTAEELLRNSDLAMYRAKSEGRRGYRFYDRRLESEINERVNVERELNRALGTRDLWVAFQPQWDLRTGHTVGAECLLRWEGRHRHNISMGKVVSIAEDCGMILPIGQWVLKEAIAFNKHWMQRRPLLRVAVNLSAVQFHHQDVYSIVMEALDASGLPASALKVEITESVLLHQSVRVRDVLRALHREGVGLVLDDFGTGYSSLTYLQQFPIETVKIDASFLQGVGKNKNDEAIVTGIIQLAHSLGQNVIAEGIETVEQLEFLKHCRCDIGQGFLYAHPMRPAEFESFLAAELGTPPPKSIPHHA